MVFSLFSTHDLPYFVVVVVVELELELTRIQHNIQDKIW